MSSQSEIYEAPSFFSTLLKPGSSLHPTFLLILDGAFATLLFIFLALLYLSSGSIHVFVLILIEFGLWGSVKWFVSELQAEQLRQEQQAVDKKLANEISLEKKTD